MRCTMARVTAFCFSLILGIAVSLVPGQRYESVRAIQGYERAGQAVGDAEPAAPLQEQSSQQPAVTFESVDVVSSGHANTQTIALRDSPQANASISVVLKMQLNESVEILDATRDYLRVRFLAANAPPEDKNRESNREGWVAWGEVMPSVSAIVLDAETGSVVSRLPLNSLDSGGVSVTFSPDNSRAIFYSDSNAHEVETENYTLKQSFRAQIAASSSLAATFFYGLTDNVLYAAIHAPSYSTQPSESMLNIMRVSGAHKSASVPEISELSSSFVVAPDGRTGFILHSANAETNEMLVDVLDLQSMRVSNSLKLHGENLPTAASSFVTSADGRELYANLFPSREVISIIDTNTGQLLREIPTGALKERSQYLSQQELVGDSLLFRFWEGEGDAEVSKSIWLSAGKTSKAQRGIDYAVEADGVRLAVNDSGTRLFKLDSDNRIREKYWIDRPDVRLDEGNAQSLGVYKLIASPDGKRIILILGTIHGC